MIDSKKPAPLVMETSPQRKLCPVCGMPAYSREGVHPQCSQQQADAPRMERIKIARQSTREGTAAASAADVSELGYWQKACPKCRAQVHVRKMKCDCGHRFYTKDS